MSVKKTQVLLVLGALVLFVLLFIAPKSAPESAEEGPEITSVSTEGTLDVYLSMALKNMEPSKKQAMEQLAAAKNHDSLIKAWGALKRPDLAAHSSEALAKTSNKAEDWFKAGNRYYYSVQFTQDQSEVPLLYQSAMRCFKKGLSLDPGNVDGKIMLASCYVEGTQNPMEGVSLLKEVEKKDSNNVKLQLTFAFFSVKSRQLDKAIIRFKKVLRIDSTYLEAYLHLADAYEQQGDTKNTVEMLEKYAARTDDVTARLEINKYIKQLKEAK